MYGGACKLFLKKLAKLNTRLDENTVIDVNFSMESGKPVISMQLNVDGAKFVAKVKGDDMYKNIDDCIAKIKTQLNKTKVSKKGSKKPDIAED